jgi:hypothetical protein
MLLGIAGVIVSGRQGWHPVHPKKKGDSKGTKKEHILIVVSALVTISVLLLNGSSWFAKHLSKPQVVNCFHHFQTANNMPNCGVWGISIVPVSNIKAFHLVVHFTKPIHDSRLVVDTFTHIKNNPVIMGHTEIDAPCEIKADRPSDRDEALTFTVSSDRQELIINGRDLSYYNSQEFLVTFYPDPDYSKRYDDLDMSGQASYEAFGHEVPADINLIDGIDGTTKTLVQ